MSPASAVLPDAAREQPGACSGSASWPQFPTMTSRSLTRKMTKRRPAA